MIKDPRKFLDDILFSIGRIENSMKNMSELEFMHNIDKQDVILRRLSIIGEAAKGLPKELTDKHKAVNWKDIAGMRDILIHEYFDIELDIVWRTLTEDLPVLKNEVTKMLKELESHQS